MTLKDKTLLESCNELFGRFTPHEGGDALQNALERFLTLPDKESAQSVYSSFLNTYRMPGLGQLLDSLRDYEGKAAPLLPRHRDHYGHSVYVYLLGIALYVHNSKLQGVIRRGIDYPDAYSSKDEEFVYRWGLAALFHDLGYPLEICAKLIDAYCSRVIAPSLVVEEGVVEHKNPPGSVSSPFTLQLLDLDKITHLNLLLPNRELESAYFEKYPELRNTHLESTLEAIAWNLSNRLRFASKNVITDTIRTAFLSGLGRCQMDHAIISASVFLRWINQFYLVSGWQPAYFYYPAVDSAAAIYLHNSLGYLYTKPPIMLPPILPEQHPMAYLLYLCDHLQEGDRSILSGLVVTKEYELSRLHIDDESLELRLKPTSSNYSKDVRALPERLQGTLRAAIDVDATFASLRIQIDE